MMMKMMMAVCDEECLISSRSGQQQYKHGKQGFFSSNPKAKKKKHIKWQAFFSFLRTMIEVIKTYKILF